jgi:hypothetical protein
VLRAGALPKINVPTREMPCTHIPEGVQHFYSSSEEVYMQRQLHERSSGEEKDLKVIYISKVSFTFRCGTNTLSPEHCDIHVISAKLHVKRHQCSCTTCHECVCTVLSVMITVSKATAEMVQRLYGAKWNLYKG